MRDALIGIVILATYFILYYFWAISFGQNYPMIGVILGIFPWIYMVIINTIGNEFKSIFYALFLSTILVWISIIIFG
jgi:hypothetical protein